MTSTVAGAVETFLVEGAHALDGSLPAWEHITAQELRTLPPLPYGDAAFSERVLRLHLDQTTDDASRSITSIRAQVAWLADILGAGALQRVFHPMCGPGLVAEALLPHRPLSYLGVDISPAAVRHARHWARQHGSGAFTFVRADIGNWSPVHPASSTAALLTYETLNALPPEDAFRMLTLARRMLQVGGTFVAEVRPELVHEAPSRRSAAHVDASLFSDEPHILLEEWLQEVVGGEVSGVRFVVLRDGCVAAVFHSVVWHHSRNALVSMLESAGFSDVRFLPGPELPTDKPAVACDEFVLATAVAP